MSNISQSYQPHELEKKWTSFWLENQIGQPQDSQHTYTMLIPPPNVTGTLHMGHGFQLTLMDILIRYHRMQGHQTLWQVGTDHAGIATQMVVERQLAQDNLTKHDLGRDKFVEKVWSWKHQSGHTITEQMKQLGITVDWDSEQFTLDPHFNQAVNKVFIDLYRQDLIYRRGRLIHWDPILKTAISDLEVVTIEKNGHMWTIAYPLVLNPEAHIQISTTRPETMFGDMALAVHPEDQRYQHLIGQHVHIPLTDRTIPVIADPEVDMTFGTGAVKITPSHDFFDEEVAQRHGLPHMSIMNPDGTLNKLVPSSYQNLDRYDARRALVKELEQTGHLISTTPHKLMLPTGDRSGAVLEPFLTDQWYMRMSDMAKKALDAVPDLCQFYPPTWENTYRHWLENIQDWCISRQLWWGHRIPAWHDDAEGKIYVGESLQDIQEHYSLTHTDHLRQDEDVLDTWFSSALWPMVTLGWPACDNKRYQEHYPTDVLVTGFDILFFWVARMVMLQQHFTGKVPFKHVYITGLIKDSGGQKMSKSKGNILDPIDLVNGICLDDLIAKRTFGLMQPQMQDKITKQTRKEFPDGIAAHGTDALRMTFTALASTNRDIRFDMQRLTGYRNFCNKIWNCSRFITHQLTQGHTISPQRTYSDIDRWLGRLMNQTISQIDGHISSYRFDLLAQTLHHFVWHIFCDWYVELKKVEIKHGHKDALGNFVAMFDHMLRLCHPVLPFITEEVGAYTAELLHNDRLCLATDAYPTSAPCASDDTTIETIISLVEGARAIRSEMNVSPKEKVPAMLHGGSELTDWQHFIEQLTSCTLVPQMTKGGIIATHRTGQITLSLDLTGLIDAPSEKKRLQLKKEKLSKELAKVSQKRNQPHYQEKAPAHIKEQDNEALGLLEKQISELDTYLSLL